MHCSHQASAALVGAAALLLACQDATQPIAADIDSNTIALRRSPGVPAVISLGAPLFGLDAPPGGGLLAAVASAGVVSVKGNTVSSLATLPGVNDIAAIGHGVAFAVTGGSLDPSQIFPTSRKLFRVSAGETHLIADLWAFEQVENPDQGWHTGPTAIESNPFDVALVNRGRVLVADAAANDILIVKADGEVDWVAVLTPVSTPGPQPVPTSVAVGPDGAYYVGELTGFPGTPGLSRIWRIARGSRHVECPSAACTLVANGFTSIMDLAFGHDGRLYVVEFDEASWLAVEENGFAMTPAGGTVNVCDVPSGSCSVVASGLSLPTAITVDRTGTLWVAEHLPFLFAGARVRSLCETAGVDGPGQGTGSQSLPSCGD